MMKAQAEPLRRLTARIFAAAGSNQDESTTIARHLVSANLAGHDSHGVARIPRYVGDLKAGFVTQNARVKVLREGDAFATLDGLRGFGQVVGEQAMAIGIAKARKAGVCAIALRNSAHLGRIADWAEQAAEAGLMSLHFVNTTGRGMRVAPFGGRDQRISTNPIGAGVPVPGRPPVILDIATSAVAEGKVMVAANAGKQLPQGALIDNQGRASTDPKALYTSPPGALLTFGGYKGYGLAVFVEFLAGALTGGGGADPAKKGTNDMANNMMSVLLSPPAFADAAWFDAEVLRLVEWITGSPPAETGGRVMMPGDPERELTAKRLAEGCPIDDETWRQILATAASLGVDAGEVDRLMAA